MLLDSNILAVPPIIYNDQATGLVYEPPNQEIFLLDQLLVIGKAKDSNPVTIKQFLMPEDLIANLEDQIDIVVEQILKYDLLASHYLFSRRKIIKQCRISRRVTHQGRKLVCINVELQHIANVIV